MKAIVLLFGLLTTNFYVSLAQPDYRVTYTLSGNQAGKGILRCTAKGSFYQEQEVKISRKETGSKPEPLADSTISEAMSRVNRGKPTALNTKFGSKRTLPGNQLVYAEQDTPYLYTVQDNTLPIWTIMDEHRKIGNYDCQLARTLFHGREYQAWFTKQIPISAGPWKLAGLPGLILEATSADQKYQFLFDSCVVAKLLPQEVNMPFKGPILTYLQYLQKYNLYYQQ